MFPSDLTNLMEIYAGAICRSPNTVSRLASGSGDFYARLKNGADVTTKRAMRIVQWLSDHWPDDLEWPHDIPRPAPSKDAA